MIGAAVRLMIHKRPLHARPRSAARQETFFPAWHTMRTRAPSHALIEGDVSWTPARSSSAIVALMRALTQAGCTTACTRGIRAVSFATSAPWSPASSGRTRSTGSSRPPTRSSCSSGPGWLTAADANGKRRIDDPRDAVRKEVASALKSGTRVIPVLVGDARLPAEEDLRTTFDRWSGTTRSN